MRTARLRLVLGECHAAEHTLRTVAASATGDMRLPPARALGKVLAADPTRHVDTLAWYHTVLADQPIETAGIMLDEFMAWAQRQQRIDDAHDVLVARLSHLPEDSHAMRWLALILLDQGKPEQGVNLLERVIELNPDDAAAQRILQLAREQYGQ